MGCGGVMRPGNMVQPKTLYNRWKRWCDMGVFARIMEGLASEAAEQKTVMIDATYLKAHRTASSLAVKRGARRRGDRAHERRAEHQASCCGRRQGAAAEVLHDGWPGQRLHGCCRPSAATCHRRSGFWPTGVMTPTGIEKR